MSLSACTKLRVLVLISSFSSSRCFSSTNRLCNGHTGMSTVAKRGNAVAVAPGRNANRDSSLLIVKKGNSASAPIIARLDRVETRVNGVAKMVGETSYTTYYSTVICG